MQRSDIFADFQTNFNTGSTPPTPPPTGAPSSIRSKAYPYIDYAVCPSTPTLDRTNPWTRYVANCGRNDQSTVNTTHPNLGGPDTRDTAVFFNQTLSSAVYTTSSFISSGDGETNTLMLSENADAHLWSDSDEYTCGFVYDTTANAVSNVNVNRVTPPPAGPTGSPWTMTPLLLTNARPSSSHPGGVVMAFCDARVKFAREEISTTLVGGIPALRVFMTPNGKRGTDLSEATPTGISVFAE
jgi:hypothetical protein